MIMDEYFMNKITGEIKASGEAIHEFYKNHGALERWTDEWEPTGQNTGKPLAAPDFRRAVRV